MTTSLPSFNSIASLLAEIFLILFHTTVLALLMISGQICIIGKLEYLWNKNTYHKKKNAILLYFENTFKRAYFWNDLFFGSYALKILI